MCVIELENIRMKILATIFFLLTAASSYAVCPTADITGNCRVNIFDMMVLVSHWLADGEYNTTGCPLADVTGDCRVNFRDFAELASQWMTDGEIVFGFERNSRDYVLINNVGVVVEPGRMVESVFPICSSLSLIPTVIDGQTNAAMQGENENYLFATNVYGGGSSFGSVYRLAKTTGANWETAAVGQVTKLWPLEGSRLIGTINDTSKNFVLKVSSDNGTTWTASAVPPVKTSDNAYFMTLWAVAHKPTSAGGPVTLMCEYGLKPNEGQRIHKSTDFGRTWTTSLVLNPAEFPASSINIHFHTIGYHKATNRWLAVVGDGQNRCFFYSDDDGTTWTKTHRAVDGSGEQPVVLLDYGHPTEFLAASDRGNMVHTIDAAALPNAVFRPLITTHNVPWSGPGIVFAMKRYNDIFYAFECDVPGNGGVRYNKIYVSKDAEKWAVAYQFTSNERGPYVYVSGVDGDGYIHITVVSGSGYPFTTYKFKQPTIQDQPVIRIQPAVSNLLASENKSIGSTDTSVWQADASRQISQSIAFGGLFADRFTRITKSPDNDVIDLRNAGTQGTSFARDGRAIYSRIIMKGRTLNANSAAGETYGGQGYASRGVSDKNLQGLLNSDIWVERLLPPFITTGSGGVETSPSVYLVWNPVGIYAGLNPHIDIGALMFSSVPSGFQLGGDDRTASQLSRTFAPVNDWTDAFAVIPDVRASTMVQYKSWSNSVSYTAPAWVVKDGKTWESKTAVGNINKEPQLANDYWGEVASWKWHVKTYRVDDGNYLCCYLDAQDNRFKLAIVVDGKPQEVLSQPAAMNFEWKSQLNFAVRVDTVNGVVSFTVQYAGTTHHMDSSDSGIAAAVRNGLFSQPMTQLVGDMPMLADKSLNGDSRGDMTTVPMAGYYSPAHWLVERYLSGYETEQLFADF